MATFTPREMALLALCRPELAPALLRAMDGFERETGRKVYLSHGFRPRSEQAALYADSLDVNGTQRWRVAPPGMSRHELGAAGDLHIVGIERQSHPLYQRLGAHIERAGLKWGGRFGGTLPDVYHAEIDEPLSVARAKWTALRGRHLQVAGLVILVIASFVLLFLSRKT